MAVVHKTACSLVFCPELWCASFLYMSAMGVWSVPEPDRRYLRFVAVHSRVDWVLLVLVYLGLNLWIMMLSLVDRLAAVHFRVVIVARRWKTVVVCRFWCLL